MPFLKTLSKNSLYRILFIILTLFSGIIVTRSIGEEGRGVYNLFLTSLALLNIFSNLGFNNSTLLVANKYTYQISKFFTFNLVLTIVSFIVAAILMTILPNIITLNQYNLIWLFAFIYFIYSLSLNLRQMLTGNNNLLFTNKVDVCSKIISLLITLLLYKLNKLNVFAGLLLIGIEYLIFSVFSYRKMKIGKLDFNFDFKFFKHIFNYNVKSYIYGLLLFLLLRSDQYLAKLLLGNFKLGIYSQFGTIAEQMQIFSGIAATIMLPKFLEESNYLSKIKKTNRLLLFIFTLYVLIAIVLIFLAPFIVEIYFKNKNPLSVDTLRIVLLGTIPWAMYSILSSMITSVRIKKSNLVILSLVLLLNFSINFFFATKIGIVGIAINSSICYFLLFILTYIDMFWLKKKNYKKHYNENL